MSRPPISTQQYHAREFGKRLIELGESDYNMLHAFLDIFDGNTLRRFATTFSDSHRLKDLLDALPNKNIVDNCLLLTKKGWFACATSARDILRAHTRGHFISPTRRDTHESTSANQMYGHDPICIEEGGWEAHMRQLGILLQNYDRTARAPAFFFPNLLPHYVSLEGDVRQVSDVLIHLKLSNMKYSTFCLVQVIYPVVTILNAVLLYNKFPCRLSVRSQASTQSKNIPSSTLCSNTPIGNSRVYIDHLIMLHANNSDRQGSPLVIHEEKVRDIM
jgi:hypothetical protein